MKIDNFIAIDFETATFSRSSICEVGICVVRHGAIVQKHSWLVQPEDNYYYSKNISIHGITPKDTYDAPSFPEVWEKIERMYLDEFDTLVAHNASFDKGCLEAAAQKYHLHLPALQWYCSCQMAKRIYRYPKNTLDYLCDILDIPMGQHHRAGDDAEMCARLFLRELADFPG